MTVSKLAELAGCAKSYISQIETGARGAPPGDEVIARLEAALGLEAGVLQSAAKWERTPGAVKRRVEELEERERGARDLVERLKQAAGRRGALDELHRSGELQKLIGRVGEAEEEGEGGARAEGSRTDRADARSVARAGAARIPLINSVAAGYPREFTDLGYPARVADQYVRVPDVTDPDAFAARVVGESMLPEYREGDIVVFSPARDVKSGMDCFVRLEPDHETTFKRVYIEGEEGSEVIRLQPLNPAFAARTVGREEVAGMYAAVSVTRSVG